MVFMNHLVFDASLFSNHISLWIYLNDVYGLCVHWTVMPCLEPGTRSRWPSDGPSNQSHSVILIAWGSKGKVGIFYWSSHIYRHLLHLYEWILFAQYSWLSIVELDGEYILHCTHTANSFVLFPCHLKSSEWIFGIQAVAKEYCNFGV